LNYLFNLSCILNCIGALSLHRSKTTPESNMRAPVKTEASIAAEAHFKAVKEICGSTELGSWSMDDHKVYSRFTGAPEAVAARVLEARKARGL
jgi:hypothetical protein